MNSSAPLASCAVAPAFQAEVFALWDSLAAFSPSRTEEALEYFCDEAGRLLGGDSVNWCTSVRMASGEAAEQDLCLGWRVRDLVVRDPVTLTRVRLFLTLGQKQNPVHLGQTTINILRQSGSFRVYRLHDGTGWLDLEAFQKTEHYQVYYAPIGLTDRMWICCPVTAEMESGFYVDRYDRSGRSRFSDQEAAGAEFLLRGLGWFHRRLLISRGLVAENAPCTPAQRETLALLLTGKSEKEIAHALGLNLKTAHHRVTAIFKRFGVKSRAELMALWL